MRCASQSHIRQCICYIHHVIECFAFLWPQSSHLKKWFVAVHMLGNSSKFNCLACRKTVFLAHPQLIVCSMKYVQAKAVNASQSPRRASAQTALKGPQPLLAADGTNISREEVWRAAQQAAQAANTRACVCAVICSQVFKVRKKVPKRVAELFTLAGCKVCFLTARDAVSWTDNLISCIISCAAVDTPP
jgi:hypothetical protein